jgi:hypothetical protein
VSGYAYQAYGLNIQSAIALPELRSAGAVDRADLLIQFQAVQAPELGERAGRMTWTESGEASLAFRDAGAFQVRVGQEILVDPAPQAAESLLRLYLLGPVLAVALHQRGWLILHASAVDLGGRVVAFLGGSGWGKSTLAAALQQRSHPLVADDFIAVPTPALATAAIAGASVDDQAAALPRVYPGFPQLKLWPEAAASLGAVVAELPRVHPDFDKRAQRLSAGFAREALPLSRLYVLAEGEPASLQPLDKPAALVDLVRHSYMANTLSPGAAAAHLRQCAALLRVVGLSRLQRPLALPELPAICALVEADAVAAQTG